MSRERVRGYLIMPHDVSVVGPLNIDLLIKGAGPPNWDAIPTWDGRAQMDMTAAGSVGYTVQDLARLGLNVRVSSCLSDDPLGIFIEDTLRRAGVDTSSVQRVPGTLGGIGVYMLLFGSRKRPLSYRLPTHPLWSLTFSPAEVDRLLDARCLHQGGYLHFKEAWHGATLKLFREAKALGLITTLDPQFPLFPLTVPWLPAFSDVLPWVDVLFCDENEALNITGVRDLDSAAHYLLSAGAKTVVVKQGAEGSTVYQRDYRYHQPAILLGVVEDTIGAGDAYDAGFIYGTLQGWSLERRALFASVAAGFTVTGVGGSQTMPDLPTILAEMERHLSSP
jgi:sugar/nucleoside kinase (ribokinase family)